LESNDSAFCALTDFRREYPITVEADSSIDETLGDMNRLSVHALLVTRQALGNIEQQVVGLITYYDIERRRPHRYPQTAVSSERSNIRVGDVMTLWNELSLLHYESLQSLTARDLYEMFQGTGLTHLLVVGGTRRRCCDRGQTHQDGQKHSLAIHSGTSSHRLKSHRKFQLRNSNCQLKRVDSLQNRTEHAACSSRRGSRHRNP
jgi:CBS domain-containing protein